MLKFLAGILALTVIALMWQISEPVPATVQVDDPYAAIPEITPEAQEEIACNKANAIRTEGKLPLLKCDDANSRVEKAR